MGHSGNGIINFVLFTKLDLKYSTLAWISNDIELCGRYLICGTHLYIDVTDSDCTLAYQQVRAIIDQDLSANQRAIIDMRELQGMEFDDIAARLGMQPATVRVELSRARKRVREIYRNKKES